MVDGVVIGTTIVSMVVNGMCCAYQQHEEEENRVKIRRDLRAEYWQQKILDEEIMQEIQRKQQVRRQQHEETREGCVESSSSSLSPQRYMFSGEQAERRSRLQLAKIRASGSLQSLVDAPDDPPPMSNVLIQPGSRRSRSNCSNQWRREKLTAASALVKTASLMDSALSGDDDDDVIQLIGSNECYDDEFVDIEL